MKRPKIRKKRQHDSPSMKQLPTAFFRRRMTAVRFPAVLVALTAGMRTAPMELVTAEGNWMQGSAMPVSTPYSRSASEVSSPYSLRQMGMEAASMLWTALA